MGYNPLDQGQTVLVRDIMSTDVPTVSPSTPVDEVLHIMVESKSSLLPVVGPDREVLGVITEHDLMFKARPLLIPPHSVLDRIRRSHDAWDRFQAELRKALGSTAGELMTSPAITVEETARVTQLADIMVERNLKQVPVVSNGRLVGVVTRAHVLRALLEHRL